MNIDVFYVYRYNLCTEGGKGGTNQRGGDMRRLVRNLADDDRRSGYVFFTRKRLPTPDVPRCRPILSVMLGMGERGVGALSYRSLSGMRALDGEDRSG